MENSEYRIDATLSNSKPVSAMSLVEIAEQLEKVTSWIEQQRVQEREARKNYEQIKTRVESAIAQINSHTKQLVEAQRRKMNSFDTMFGQSQAASAPAPSAGGRRAAAQAAAAAAGGPPKNMPEAIIRLWTSGKFSQPLTTEEIVDGLSAVGYESNAKPSSLKSSVNQAIAKLASTGYLLRMRSDNTRISIRDKTSRARKYIAASAAPDEE